MTSPHDPIFLLGLGAQKSGTSWLAAQLNQHPQFLVSPVKEIHYWDRRFFPEMFGDRNIARKLDKLYQKSPKKLLDSPLLEVHLMERHEVFYKAFFQSRLTAQHKAFGEFSPSYCFLAADHFSYIKSFMNQRMKVIFIMRDPVARFWSQCKMEFQKGRSRGKPFDPIATFEKQFDHPKFQKRGDYIHTVNNIDKVFGDDEALVLFFEELFEPSAANRICDFIEIDRMAFDTTNNPNEGVPLAKPSPASWRRVQEAYHPIYEYVERRMGYLPQAWSGASRSDSSV